MTKALITAAALVAMGQMAQAATVDFTTSLFSDNSSTVSTTIDGVAFTFWAESAGTPERFYRNSGLSFGYSHMHAVTMVADQDIQITTLNGKSSLLDPSGASLPLSILLEDAIQVGDLVFPSYSWGWLDLADDDVIIPANTEFTIDGDFESWNWQARTVLAVMGFEAYTPPPIALPGAGFLLIGALGAMGMVRRRVC
ncbi:hypothetical protein [Donghicola sp. XS_ASV15]|uniref:hypothetical protein n=1 Tax=Donghicola sp. XS_ASV15 TaxID=3241295 RepID=UPI00351413F3